MSVTRLLRRHASQLIRGTFLRAGVHLIRSPFSRDQAELYGPIRQLRPQYVNLGAGSFAHPMWHNVDMPNAFYKAQQSIHIAHDFTSTEPLAIESKSVEVFYCSHVIEHLSNDAVQYLFREVHRCLKPSGIFRVTCPDMMVHWRAYKTGDTWLWPHTSGWGTRQASMEQRFLEYFATMLSEGKAFKALTDARVRELSALPMDQFFDTICSMLPNDANVQMPEGHCNWFTTPKVLSFLQMAGFSDVWESRYLQSVEPKLRAPCHFDFVCPDHSLYMECRKS